MALWNGGGAWNTGILWGPIPAPIFHKQKHQRNTMKKQDYYPSKLAAQPEWLENFAEQLEAFGPTIPLTPALVTAGAADAGFLAYCIGAWLTKVREFSPGCTAAVETLKFGTGTAAVVLPTFTAPDLPAGVAPVAPGALDRIFSLVGLIKKSPGYTPEIGTLMGIIGAEDATEHLAPTMKLKVEAGTGGACQCVKVMFKKYGHAGVAVYSRRGNGAWEQIDIAQSSPYMDVRPLLVPTQPEVREYRLRFWDGEESGDWTDIASVTVAP